MEGNQPAPHPWWEAFKTVHCRGCKKNHHIGKKTHTGWVKCKRCKKLTHRPEECPGSGIAHSTCTEAPELPPPSPPGQAQPSALKRAAVANGRFAAM